MHTILRGLEGSTVHGLNVNDGIEDRDEMAVCIEPLPDAMAVAVPDLGDLQAQKQRLAGQRGQKRVHRPELGEMCGFDAKYAMHMPRLGSQGIELLTTGTVNWQGARKPVLHVIIVLN